MTHSRRASFEELSSETWTSRTHPVRFTCDLIAHSALLLAGALSVLWLMDSIRLPRFDTLGGGMISKFVEPIERTGKTLEYLAEVLK